MKLFLPISNLSYIFLEVNKNCEVKEMKIYCGEENKKKRASEILKCCKDYNLEYIERDLSEDLMNGQSFDILKTRPKKSQQIYLLENELECHKYKPDLSFENDSQINKNYEISKVERIFAGIHSKKYNDLKKEFLSLCIDNDLAYNDMFLFVKFIEEKKVLLRLVTWEI